MLSFRVDSTPKSQIQLRPERTLLSPPPSPPTRLSTLSESPLDLSKTPTRASWHGATDWTLTPRIDAPAEMRTSDSRLIRAKRESDQALAACRTRLEQLQNDCTKSKEDVRLAQVTARSLEHEIQSHQTRIAKLERSRAAVEETLRSTRSHLDLALLSEDRIKQELQVRKDEITNLEQNSAEQQHAIEAMQVEKDALEETLQARNVNHECQETRIAKLEGKLHSLQCELDTAKRQETSLRDRLEQTESAREDLRKRFDRGSQYLDSLQQKIVKYESDVEENLKKIKTGGDTISMLREQLKQSEEQRTNTEGAMTNVRSEMALLQDNLQHANNEHYTLATELESARLARKTVEGQLQLTKSTFLQEQDAKRQLQFEQDKLRSSFDHLTAELQAANKHVLLLEGADGTTHAQLEMLRDNKAALEADLRDARQALFRLRENLRMESMKLAEVESSEADMRQKLRTSAEQKLSLEKQLDQERLAKEENAKHFATDLHRSNAQALALESSMHSLQAVLNSSAELKKSLQVELDQAQASKEQLRRN